MTFCMHTSIDHVYVVSLTHTGNTLSMSTWRYITDFKGQAHKCDNDKPRLSTPVSLLLQQPTSNDDKVEPVELPLWLRERFLEGNSQNVVRNPCTDTSLGPQSLSEISKYFGCKEDPEAPSRPQECVPSRKYTGVHQGMQS